jgi:hypothetical protein
MPDPNYPSPEGIIECLRRSGWSCKVSGFTTSSGGVFYQVDGSRGSYRIRVQGRTAREAWHKAMLAVAAACRMLVDWKRPSRDGQ